MKLIDVPHDATFLDLDGIPVVKVVKVVPEQYVAFTAGKPDVEPRPYPNALKAGLEGDRLPRDKFVDWLVTGRDQFGS